MRLLSILRNHSDLSIRAKLFAPTLMQALVAVAISALLLVSYQSLTGLRKSSDAAAATLSKLAILGNDLGEFAHGNGSKEGVEVGIASVTEHIAALNNPDWTEKVEEFESNLAQYHEQNSTKNQLIREMYDITSSSFSASNASIVNISERLTDPYLRFDVATSERVGMSRAMKDTTNKIAIRDTFLAFERGEKTVDQSLAILESVIADSEQLIPSSTDTASVAEAEKMVEINRVLKEVFVAFADSVTTMKAIQGQLIQQHADLVEDVSASSNSSLNGVYEHLDLLVAGFFLTLITMVGVSLLSSTLLAVSVVRPLNNLKGHIVDIASKGSDLKRRLDESRKDELGGLARGVNHLLTTLQDVFVEVKDVGERLSNSSALVANDTRESATRMSEQHDRMSSIIDSVSTIQSTVEGARQRSASAMEAADLSESRVSEVVESISKTIAVVKEANIELQNAGIVIGRLNEDSQNIGNILEVIRGIAEQTNLLALNAAIEAARAGDQGRGFAVVADEVRSLAQRTQSSTQEIDKVITSLQGASMLATGVLTSTTENISSTLDSSKLAGDGVQVIADCIKDIKKINTDMVEMMENQLDRATSINESVTEMGHMSDSISTSVVRANDTSEKQAHDAAALNELIRRFSI